MLMQQKILSCCYVFCDCDDQCGTYYKIRQVEKAVQEKKKKKIQLNCIIHCSIRYHMNYELLLPLSLVQQIICSTITKTYSLKIRMNLIAEISKASFRLNQQVENLLNMSRLESGFIKPRKIGVISMNWCTIQ